MMHGLVSLGVSVAILLCCIGESEEWSGGCHRHVHELTAQYYTTQQCRYGWTHDGDYNCNIPVCRPSCKNGGVCTNPNYCDCPSTATGATTGCQDLTCSYQLPCYPGDCHDINECTCEPGFKSARREEGCLSFDETVNDMVPVIAKSTATLSMVRRSDNRLNFMYSIDGTGASSGGAQIEWLNQKRFNTLEFELESSFTPETLPGRPNYVHEVQLGIVSNHVTVNVSKLPRDGGIIRDPGSYSTHVCDNGASDSTPNLDVSTCTIFNDQFSTLIEHGDWMTVTYRSRNGGYRKLLNIDDQSTPYATNYFNGLTGEKKVEFRFDFIAPKHCTEAGAFDVCPENADKLSVELEFTQVAIRPRWSGWTDDLSGVWQYYVEVFLLGPDPYRRLIEVAPLHPVFSDVINVTGGDALAFPEYTPAEPGMYSGISANLTPWCPILRCSTVYPDEQSHDVLLEVRDEANNTRTARTLVLYDDQSEIALQDDHKLHVSSAVAETGYTWQTANEGDDTTITVSWWDHFVNRLHEDGMLLHQVMAYPIQFEDIKDDGYLFAKKYVNDTLDDHEGLRTRDAIRNIHGIVRFEKALVYTEDTAEPPNEFWTEISPLAETTTFTEQLNDGAKIRVWIKAHDAMGATQVDSTTVHFDTSQPKVSGANSTRTKLLVNVDSDEYMSRLVFDASDDQSGVHKIEYRITAHVENKPDRLLYANSTTANIDLGADPETHPSCRDVLGTCFLVDQSVDLSNCWFMVNKEDLDNASATIYVTVYNQAMLSQSLVFQVNRINELKGLETYAGPTNFRTELLTERGFRVAWDLPEKASCYGRADIVILLYRKGADGVTELETFIIQNTATYFDINALDPDASYQLQFGMKLEGNEMTTGTSLDVQTAAEESDTSGVIIAVVAVAVVVCVALLLAAFLLLLRRGHMQPVRRGLRAMTVRYRQTFYGGDGGGGNDYVTDGPSTGKGDSCTSPKRPMSTSEDDMYIYGGMDFDTGASWNLARSDVTFQSMIKSGHFANVYQSKLKGSREIVAAKTLKEGYTAQDKLVMTAKINFTGTVVGHHPNVLKFVGAVTDDVGMGPFIIYEYCENGPLSEYLRSHKDNMSVQLEESLFRFGRSIAIGMEHLASKGIVHRRLAARNILLTSEEEVKIAGFGPQPAGDGADADAETGKKERIPVKWSAPECMASSAVATEKSDVWSFAVVLWEIFSLGDTPYSNIRGRDLPAKVKQGERLGKPGACDDTWYGVMLKCWNLKPDKRPTFSDIRGELDELFVASAGDENYYYQR